jgi:HSP20 family protein
MALSRFYDPKVSADKSNSAAAKQLGDRRCVMTIVRRPSPFGELISLRQAMDRLFEDSFVGPRQWASGVLTEGILPVDVRTNEGNIEIEAALPGVRPEDVQITLENGVLTISAESETSTTDEDGPYLVKEIRRGSFSRTISLPEGLEADRAKAQFGNGMLQLRIPKAERTKSRQIRITPTVNEGSSGESSGSGSSGSSTAPASSGPETKA